VPAYRGLFRAEISNWTNGRDTGAGEEEREQDRSRRKIGVGENQKRENISENRVSGLDQENAALL